MARILVTNGGQHPPEKWAMTTASLIFDIDGNVAGDRLIMAQKFQLTIAELLMPYYDKMQVTEASKLKEDVNHILTPHSAEEYLDDVIKDIQSASKGTPWAAHFAKPEVVNAMAEVIASHIGTAQHVTRLWHSDNNPDCEVSQSYKAMFRATG